MNDGLFALLGGIGLFLLGMRLMTDGLTASAGGLLRTILAGATRSRGRALMSGLIITTGVQSSSAVIFATIGFVNAGLLSLGQSIGLVYGANLGTTLTSWLVAVAGFNLNLRALALPAIGLGAVAWAISRSSRWGALGQAVAGFGLFFLGIDVLRDAFDGLGGLFSAQQDAGTVVGIATFVLSGIVITLLTQSSSATLAITLTAAAGGLLSLPAAAAMIIGANVGTTSTAVFAAIGATSSARRVAAAHVLFNVVTAVIALGLLPALLWLAAAIAALASDGPHIALSLAVFHSLTKLLGVGVMWPLTPRVVSILGRRFRSTEEDQARPQHLDANLLATPALAMDALGMELHRMSTIAVSHCLAALQGPRGHGPRLEAGRGVIESLQSAVGEYSAGIHHRVRGSVQDGRLPDALRVAQYHVNLTELAPELARLRPQAHLEVEEPALLLHTLRTQAADLLQAAGQSPDVRGDDIDGLLEQFEDTYQTFKAAVLRAGSAGEVTPRRMAAVLEYGSILRRICNQADKATAYLDRYFSRDGDAGDQGSGGVVSTE